MLQTMNRPFWQLPDEEEQDGQVIPEMDPTESPLLPRPRTPLMRTDAPPEMVRREPIPDMGDGVQMAIGSAAPPDTVPNMGVQTPRQAMPKMETPQTDKLIEDAARVSQEKPKLWQQILGGVLSVSPRTRGIDVHPNITRHRQDLGIQQMLADEERKAQQAQVNLELKGEQIAMTDAQKQAALAQRDASAKKLPSIEELSAMKFPDGRPVFTPEQITILLGGGKLREPKQAPVPKVTEDVNHWIAVSQNPNATPEERNTANAKIAKWQETNKEKPDAAAKENTNQWIADSLNPDPAISGPAKQKIAMWERTQKNQRPTIINQAAIPSNPAIDQAAVRYATTGELPPMGMGSAGGVVRSKIMDRAAELFPDANLAGNKATYGADKNSLASLQKTADTVNAFEGLARKNLDRFVEVAKKTVDSGQPWANRAFRGGARMLGDPNAANFEAARVTAFTEIAKVLNNPTSNAVLSDSARKEAEGILNGNYTIPQLVSVANLIKQEMATRKTENQRALDEIRGRMTGGKVKSTTEEGNSGLSNLSTEELLRRLAGGK